MPLDASAHGLEPGGPYHCHRTGELLDGVTGLPTWIVDVGAPDVLMSAFVILKQLGETLCIEQRNLQRVRVAFSAVAALPESPGRLRALNQAHGRLVAAVQAHWEAKRTFDAERRRYDALQAAYGREIAS